MSMKRVVYENATKMPKRVFYTVGGGKLLQKTVQPGQTIKLPRNVPFSLKKTETIE